MLPQSPLGLDGLCVWLQVQGVQPELTPSPSPALEQRDVITAVL